MEPKLPILLVDDDSDDLFAMRTVLESLGRPIVEAHSGEEALHHVLKQDFAVILLDLLMPKLNGLETATLIRQRDRCRNVPLIFLTGFDAEDVHLLPGYSTLLKGEYLRKPVSGEVLRSKVLACLAQRGTQTSAAEINPNPEEGSGMLKSFSRNPKRAP